MQNELGDYHFDGVTQGRSYQLTNVQLLLGVHSQRKGKGEAEGIRRRGGYMIIGVTFRENPILAVWQR